MLRFIGCLVGLLMGTCGGLMVDGVALNRPTATELFCVTLVWVGASIHITCFGDGRF